MNRRGFLRFLGMGAAAAVAPKVTYSFLGGIYRPRQEAIFPKVYYSSDWKWTFAISHFEKLNPHVSGPLAARLIEQMKQYNDNVFAEMAAENRQRLYT